MTEKRLYHRMKIEVPVSFEIGSPKNLIISSTLDISATGLSFKLKEPIKDGEILNITMGTDQNKNVKVGAQVVWVKEKELNGDKEYTVGLKVIDKMDQDEIEFVRFVAKKMFEYFKPKDQVED